MGRSETTKKTRKNHKKIYSKNRKVNLHLHRKKWRLLNAKIQRLKNIYEENIISLDIYWKKNRRYLPKFF